MHYPQTTQVPNALFDKQLPNITHAELKILLIIIRQTYGWIAPQTKQRKLRDRISHGQFITKTGLSRRIVSQAIQSLVTKKLICITDFKGNTMDIPAVRQGRTSLYYAANIGTSVSSQTYKKPVMHRPQNIQLDTAFKPINQLLPLFTKETIEMQKT